MNRFLLIILLSVFCHSIFSQTLKAFEKAADKAFQEKDYYTAFVHLQSALEIRPEKAALQYKFAEAARHFQSYEIAEEYYQKVMKNEEAAVFPMAPFWLAMMKKSLGKYQEAKLLFQQFSKNQDDNYYSKRAKIEIATCEWAIQLEPKKDLIAKVEHLDKKVNTPYSEIGPLPRGDTLYYSSFRYSFDEDDHKPKRKLTKTLSSRNNSKGRTLRRNYNVSEKHTAHTTFSTDGKRIYFTICKYDTGATIKCEIYYREKDRRKRWKKDPVKLPLSINQKGFTATHPAIGYDSIEQKEILYFVSDRIGGKGKLDIWYSEITADSFSTPQNLVLINTSENDLTPFYHTPSQKLYFSSDGHSGLGGFDVFELDESKGAEAIQNLGIPINTSYNDLYYAVNRQGMIAYLSSNRPGSFYLDKSNKACCYDIFKVNFSKPEPQNETEELAEESPEEPLEDTIEPSKEPETLEDFLPLALYFDNDEPDKRTRRTSTKKSYGTTYQKYYSKKQEYLSQFVKPLDDEDRFEAEQAVEDFFEDQIKKGYEHLFLFSDILLKRLEKGEKVEIFIKGFTSPRAKSDYNLSLGKRRVSSLKNHFDSHQHGIFKPYLKNGQLIISETSFGETHADTSVSDVLNDLRGSIYHPNAAKERRVEIVEIKTEAN